MSDRAKIRKIRIVVDEDAEIVARLDAMSNAEGLSRSDMLRRAIRRMLFLYPRIPPMKRFPLRKRPHRWTR